MGGKIAQLGQGGDLRGYGGVYSYGGVGIDRYWGGRLRLEVRPNDVLSLGAGVQFDREFGTNLLFRVAASFPSLAQRQRRAGNPRLEQLANPPLRQNSVVVAQRVEPVTALAVNPSTGKSYEFVHVASGGGNGSGAFENPTGTIATATELVTPSTDIIYVQPGNAGEGFTVPAGVSVLSVAPVQAIATQFGQVALPGSGQGEAARPVITDTVTMGNNTRLSGFAIQPPPNRLGIEVEGAGNVEIMDNHVSVTNTLGMETSRTFPSGFAGVLAKNERIPESVTIARNTIETSGDFANGISSSSDQSGNMTIADNTVTTSGASAVGINANSSSGSNITIADNTVTIGGDYKQPEYYSSLDPFIFGAISANSSSGSSITIANNTATTSGSGAAGVNAKSNSGSNITIAGNTIKTSGEPASYQESFFSNRYFFLPSRGISSLSSEGSVIISDNTVMTGGNFTEGISVTSSYLGNNTTVVGNNVTTLGDGAEGIIDYSYDSSGNLIVIRNLIKTSGKIASRYIPQQGRIGPFTLSVKPNGIRVAKGGSTTIAENIVRTSGLSTEGINVDGVGMEDDIIIISRNDVITDGDAANGITVVSRRSNFLISSNLVKTNGDAANGIISSSSSGNITIADNTITTVRDNSSGISGGFFSYGSLAIMRNTVITSGNNADGISGFSYFDMSTGKFIIMENTVERSGRDAIRLELGQFGGSPKTCLALSNNISKNPGSGISYHLIKSPSEFDNTFQIVDSSPAFANTQADNIGTFVFEPSITSFTNVPACP